MMGRNVRDSILGEEGINVLDCQYMLGGVWYRGYKPDLLISLAPEYGLSYLKNYQHKAPKTQFVAYNVPDSYYLNDEMRSKFKKIARLVQDTYHKGKTVGVCCFEGKNRSSLVAALALCNLGKTGHEAMSAIVGERKKTYFYPVEAEALYNPVFRQFIYDTCKKDSRTEDLTHKLEAAKDKIARDHTKYADWKK